MGWQLVPQVKGLSREAEPQNTKQRANGKKILEEGGSERRSRSSTLDHSRSYLNEYEGYTKGSDCWDAMCAEADEYRVTGVNKKGQSFSRRLPAKSAIAWALIINPPAEATVGWSPEDYDRLYGDAFAVLGEIEPRLFREDNVRMTATHRDEGLPDDRHKYGEHMHKYGMARDASGSFCGNIIDANLKYRINTEFAKKMRDRGWDIDDPDITDYSRMGKDENGEYIDPEYRASRKAKKAGRSVDRYITDKAKAADRMLQAAEQDHVEAMAELAAATSLSNDIVSAAKKGVRDALQDIQEAAEAKASEIIAEANRKAAERLAEAQEEAEMLRRDNERLKADNERLQRRNTTLRCSNRFHDIAEAYHRRIQERLDKPIPTQPPYDEIAPKRRVHTKRTEEERQTERMRQLQEAFGGLHDTGNTNDYQR